MTEQHALLATILSLLIGELKDHIGISSFSIMETTLS